MRSYQNSEVQLLKAEESPEHQSNINLLKEGKANGSLMIKLHNNSKAVGVYD
jgi:hypothetical protein